MADILNMCVWFAAVLLLPVRTGTPLAPSALGNAVEHAGVLSNTIRQTAAWQHFRKLGDQAHNGGGLQQRLARLWPSKTMNLVSSIVDHFRSSSKEGLLDPIVNTSVGALRGRFLKSKSDPPIQYYSFRGIRYGQAPLGPRRFRAALPERPWSGIRSARKEGAVCPSRSLILDTFSGDEDCLFLNVHTPKLPREEDEYSVPLPVMVWLHGGGFSLGSGNAFLYGPDFLVAEEVVVVTLNYRLGALGYLSLGNAKVPGNAGLKDQVLALRWVQDHIDKFGGDPSRVTVFGESAGGAAVNYLLLSQSARGLFHGAISQSGSALSPWALAKAPIDRAFSLGRALGVHTNNTEELLEALWKVPCKELVDATSKTLTYEDSRNSIGIPFVPVVEAAWLDQVGVADEEREEPFLLDEPLVLLQAGAFAPVPHLTGFNSHEAMLFIRRLRKDPTLLRAINEDFVRMVPRDLNVPGGRDSPEGVQAAAEIRELYLGNKTVDGDAKEEMIFLLTDTMFSRGILTSARLHAVKAPSFVYKFSFDGALGLFKRLLGITRHGACHGDELGYLFHFGPLNLHLDPDSPELQVTRLMVRMWANFAKYGTPTPESLDDPTLGFIWPPLPMHNVSSTFAPPLPYLDITGPNMSVELNPNAERLQFWDDLYRRYNGRLL